MNKSYPTYITSLQHNQPFGMLLADRNWAAGSEYKYGFNGKENDDEIAGNNNALDFGARIYDTRLCRWFNVDPCVKLYPAYSPYNYAVGNPTNIIDRDGNTVVPFNENTQKELGQHFTKVFNEKTAKLLTENLSMDGSQKIINNKDFRNAIKSMSTDQKALARGYFKMINSKKSILFAFGSASDPIPSSALIQKSGQGFTGGTYSDIAGFGALTFINDGSTGSTYSASVVIQSDLNFGTPTDVLDTDGYAGQWLDDNGDGRMDRYETNKASDIVLDEVIIHEGMGHGFFGGILGQTKSNHFLAAIQTGNLYRKFKGLSPRSGETDHGLDSRASNPNEPFKNSSLHDVTATPKELKK